MISTQLLRDPNVIEALLAVCTTVHQVRRLFPARRHDQDMAELAVQRRAGRLWLGLAVDPPVPR